MAAAAAAKQVVRRAQLYVPGSSMRFLEKSRSLPAVDSIAYDLEDSVTRDQKPQARRNVVEMLNRARAPGIREQAVRINAVASGHASADLAAVLPGAHLDCIVVPKVDAPDDLRFVSDVLRHLLPDRHAPRSPDPVKIVALVESARGVTDLRAICQASPFLSGLAFAAEDFARDLSLTRTPSLHEFLYARSAIVTAARAHRLPSALDLVCTTLRARDRLREECENGKSLGFNGKQCIHPDQVALVQRVYSPSEPETEWAVRVVIADQKAARQGRGAWTLDGTMIDAPVVGKAEAIVAKAELCGFDVQALRLKFQGEEPA